MKLISGGLQPSIETWSDPGDYPNSLASGPLPSYQYVEEIEGKLTVLVDDPETIQFLDSLLRNANNLTDGEVEESNPDLHEIIDAEVPSGINVQRWIVSLTERTVDGSIYEFEVLEFEASDWEPDEPDYDPGPFYD